MDPTEGATMREKARLSFHVGETVALISRFGYNVLSSLRISDED